MFFLLTRRYPFAPLQIFLIQKRKMTIIIIFLKMVVCIALVQIAMNNIWRVAMKLNENYILKTVAGTPIVVPVGDAAEKIHGMITLNGPAEIIWKALENGKDYEEIVGEIKSEYDAEESVIRGDLDAFLEKLKNFGILE